MGNLNYRKLWKLFEVDRNLWKFVKATCVSLWEYLGTAYEMDLEIFLKIL